jgi:anti-anti-sigma factor
MMMTAVQDRSKDVALLRIAGPLYASLCATLASDVRALLSTGRRMILLDLAGVTAIDAAGVGALVHVYNMATAADAVLRVANTSEDVRDLLTRVGLQDLLNAEAGRPQLHVSGERQAVEAKSSV